MKDLNQYSVVDNSHIDITRAYRCIICNNNFEMNENYYKSNNYNNYPSNKQSLFCHNCLENLTLLINREETFKKI